VRNFVAPSAEELAHVGSDLPERAKVAELVEAMVEIDQHWDHLKAFREAGYKVTPALADIDPPHEALQLAEGFRELLMLDQTRAKGEDFFRRMEAIERQVTKLPGALRGIGRDISPESRKELEGLFVAVGKSCSSCHARYRDN
jgi:hypothetical protein